MSESTTTAQFDAIFDQWHRSLSLLHGWFVGMRSRTRAFGPKAFAVFFAINLACFWWALLTAKRDLLVGPKILEYFLMGFPVAVMGAMFDVVSLRLTLWAIDRALAATQRWVYLAFLSIDVVIAVAATFWVLFAFIVSGWLVAMVLPFDESLADRAHLYRGRVANTLAEPISREALTNIYFGMIMGASALIPTLVHFGMALWSVVRFGQRWLTLYDRR